MSNIKDLFDLNYREKRDSIRHTPSAVKAEELELNILAEKELNAFIDRQHALDELPPHPLEVLDKLDLLDSKLDTLDKIIDARQKDVTVVIDKEHYEDVYAALNLLNGTNNKDTITWDDYNENLDLQSNDDIDLEEMFADSDDSAVTDGNESSDIINRLDKFLDPGTGLSKDDAETMAQAIKDATDEVTNSPHKTKNGNQAPPVYSNNSSNPEIPTTEGQASSKYGNEAKGKIKNSPIHQDNIRSKTKKVIDAIGRIKVNYIILLILAISRFFIGKLLASLLPSAVPFPVGGALGIACRAIDKFIYKLFAKHSGMESMKNAVLSNKNFLGKLNQHRSASRSYTGGSDKDWGSASFNFDYTSPYRVTDRGNVIHNQGKYGEMQRGRLQSAAKTVTDHYQKNTDPELNLARYISKGLRNINRIKRGTINEIVKTTGINVKQSEEAQGLLEKTFLKDTQYVKPISATKQRAQDIALEKERMRKLRKSGYFFKYEQDKGISEFDNLRDPSKGVYSTKNHPYRTFGRASLEAGRNVLAAGYTAARWGTAGVIDNSVTGLYEQLADSGRQVTTDGKTVMSYLTFGLVDSKDRDATLKQIRDVTDSYPSTVDVNRESNIKSLERDKQQLENKLSEYKRLREDKTLTPSQQIILDKKIANVTKKINFVNNDILTQKIELSQYRNGVRTTSEKLYNTLDNFQNVMYMTSIYTDKMLDNVEKMISVFGQTREQNICCLLRILNGFEKETPPWVSKDPSSQIDMLEKIKAFLTISLSGYHSDLQLAFDILGFILNALKNQLMEMIINGINKVFSLIVSPILKWLKSFLKKNDFIAECTPFVQWMNKYIFAEIDRLRKWLTDMVLLTLGRDIQLHASIDSTVNIAARSLGIKELIKLIDKIIYYLKTAAQCSDENLQDILKQQAIENLNNGVESYYYPGSGDNESASNRNKKKILSLLGSNKKMVLKKMQDITGKSAPAGFDYSNYNKKYDKTSGTLEKTYELTNDDLDDIINAFGISRHNLENLALLSDGKISENQDILLDAGLDPLNINKFANYELADLPLILQQNIINSVLTNTSDTYGIYSGQAGKSSEDIYGVAGVPPLHVISCATGSNRSL